MEQQQKHENTQQDVTEDPGNEGIQVRTLLQPQRMKTTIKMSVIQLKIALWKLRKSR